MTTRQYIGARYVPVFADPVEWDDDNAYEALTMVQHLGETYMSRQAVPIGVQLPDTSQGEESNDYWVHMSNWNAQVETYRQEVLQYNGRISTLENDLPIADFDAENTVSDKITAIENVLPIADFDAENTVSDAITAVENTVENECSIRAIDFENVAAMKASDKLANGMIVHTLGFHAAGDGGDAYYAISSTGTANEMDVIACGDLYATLVLTGDTLTVEMLGAYGNGTDNDYQYIARALQMANSITLMPGKTYMTGNTIVITGKQIFDGNNSTVSPYDNATTYPIFKIDGTNSPAYRCDVVFKNTKILGDDGKTHNGVVCNYAAQFTLDNIIIQKCDKAFVFDNALIFNFANCVVENCNIALYGGDKTYSTTNNVKFDSCRFLGNKSVLYSPHFHFNNALFLNCEIEANDTQSDYPAVINIIGSGDGAGPCVVFSECWIEANEPAFISSEADRFNPPVIRDSIVLSTSNSCTNFAILSGSTPGLTLEGICDLSQYTSDWIDVANSSSGSEYVSLINCIGRYAITAIHDWVGRSRTPDNAMNLIQAGKIHFRQNGAYSYPIIEAGDQELKLKVNTANNISYPDNDWQHPIKIGAGGAAIYMWQDSGHLYVKAYPSPSSGSDGTQLV